MKNKQELSQARKEGIEEFVEEMKTYYEERANKEPDKEIWWKAIEALSIFELKKKEKE